MFNVLIKIDKKGISTVPAVKGLTSYQVTMFTAVWQIMSSTQSINVTLSLSICYDQTDRYMIQSLIGSYTVINGMSHIKEEIYLQCYYLQ